MFEGASSFDQDLCPWSQDLAGVFPSRLLNMFNATACPSTEDPSTQFDEVTEFAFASPLCYPCSAPTSEPSTAPSDMPSDVPSDMPSDMPSALPSQTSDAFGKTAIDWQGATEGASAASFRIYGGTILLLAVVSFWW